MHFAPRSRIAVALLAVLHRKKTRLGIGHLALAFHALIAAKKLRDPFATNEMSPQIVIAQNLRRRLPSQNVVKLSMLRLDKISQ